MPISDHGISLPRGRQQEDGQRAQDQPGNQNHCRDGRIGVELDDGGHEFRRRPSERDDHKPCENRAKEPSEPVEPQLNGRIQDHQHAARQDHARPEAGHVGRTAHEGAVGQPRDNRH